MGMLMHHTWLEQQKKKAEEKPVAEVKVTEEVPKEPETAQRKPGGRRKVTK